MTGHACTKEVVQLKMLVIVVAQFVISHRSRIIISRPYRIAED